MAEAISLAKLQGTVPVDRALGVAASPGPFGEEDLASILRFSKRAASGAGAPGRERHTLQPGTGAWERLR